jgi:GntR family transcriptional regulator
MSVPLHISISEKLRGQIAAGDYLPGEKLPSEHQLMATFGVSRITVRQAIANLVNQGLVQARQGKGVFVTLHKKVAYSLSDPMLFLAQDMARQGIEFGFENLVFEAVPPPKKVQIILNLTEQTQAYLQKKLLRMDGAVGAVDISYILPELGQRLGDRLVRQMTFPTLEENAVAIKRIDAVIECTYADYELSGCLEVPIGQPLIVYCYTAHTSEQPILYGETISRADRFCYSLRLEHSSALE